MYMYLETFASELFMCYTGLLDCQGKKSAKTSQVTYVTMVPRVGNETLRPLGVAMGNVVSVTRV